MTTFTSPSAATTTQMSVAMGNLLFGRHTNFLHGDVKVEVLTREWVVTIDGDVIIINFEIMA